DFSGEYGPAATDVRHRVLIGGTLNLRWNIRLNPLFTIQSGSPFKITTGPENYGNTLFKAQPRGAANPPLPGWVQTPYGLFDPNIAPGEMIVPRNYGRGPQIVMVNLRIAKTWGFGPERGAGAGAVRSNRGDSGQATGPALSAPTGRGGMFGQPST